MHLIIPLIGVRKQQNLVFIHFLYPPHTVNIWEDMSFFACDFDMFLPNV